jgi:hypothetical protein
MIKLHTVQVLMLPHLTDEQRAKFYFDYEFVPCPYCGEHNFSVLTSPEKQNHQFYSELLEIIPIVFFWHIFKYKSCNHHIVDIKATQTSPFRQNIGCIFLEDKPKLFWKKDFS